MDYGKAKVYCIRNYNDNDVYVGSTCQPLSKRMADHRMAMNSKKRDFNMSLYVKMREQGANNFYIELIEEYPCENKEQLRAKEGEYIRSLSTLNRRIEGRTKKEYKQDYKEQIKVQGKEYYKTRSETICAKNRQHYNEIASVKMTCDVCGSIHNKKNKPLHLRTKKHQEALNNLNNINNVCL